MSALFAPKTASCLIPSILLCLSISCPVRAHNGAVAIAVPVERPETSP